MGLESGIEYVFNDTLYDSVQLGSGEAIRISTDQRTRLISPGSEGNAFITLRIRFRADENGNVIFDEFSTDFECRG